MVVRKGKDLLLKIFNGTSYETVAGLRSKRLTFNAETVDVTDAESAGRWRELLGGAGASCWAALACSARWSQGLNLQGCRLRWPGAECLLQRVDPELADHRGAN